MAIAGFDSNGDSRPDVLTGDPITNEAFLYDAGPKPNPPAVTIYGATCPDSQGRLARAAAAPAPRLGASIRMQLRAAAPNSIALFVLAANELPST